MAILRICSPVDVFTGKLMVLSFCYLLQNCEHDAIRSECFASVLSVCACCNKFFHGYNYMNCVLLLIPMREIMWYILLADICLDFSFQKPLALKELSKSQ
jgi:hypothetical protein